MSRRARREPGGAAAVIDPTGEVEGTAEEEIPRRPPQGLRHAMRALRHRDYAIFWSGALVSNTGSWVQNVTVPYVLYQLTSSGLWVGMATLAQFVPAMVFGPLAGSIADRFDRRRTMLVTQALTAAPAFALWLAWGAGVRSPGVIVALVALSGSFFGLSLPTWQAYMHDLVPRDDILSAVALNSLQFNAARALGPAIGGVLLATLGPSWAFLINAVSFVFVLIALVAIHSRSSPRAVALRGGFIRQFRRALRYSARHPGILLGLVVGMLVGAFGSPVFQFTVIFAADVFHVGPLGLSALNVSLGVGAVCAAPLVSGWDAVISRSTLVRWALLVYGVGVISFALAPVYAVGLVALFVDGGAFLVVISTVNTSIQLIVADHMRGRMMALRIMSYTAALPAGAVIQGALSDVIGPRPTVAAAGAILLTASLWQGSRPGLLGRLDDPHDEALDVDGG